MIEEILKKETFDEKDVAILVANRHLLSQKDLIRLGFEATPEVEEPEVVVKKTIKK